MSRNIFISHSSKDKEKAYKICEILEKSGLSCWIAPRDIRPAFNWDEEILDGIDQTKVFILLLSENSNISEHVKKELHFASNKKIFPIRIQEILPGNNLKYLLGLAHFIDAFEPPLESKLKPIIEIIKALQDSDNIKKPKKILPVELIHKKIEKFIQEDIELKDKHSENINTNTQNYITNKNKTDSVKIIDISKNSDHSLVSLKKIKDEPESPESGENSQIIGEIEILVSNYQNDIADLNNLQLEIEYFNIAANKISITKI
jgi:hypothetical protein